jgi:hypothetical protein
MKTLNNLIDNIREFANAHLQINYFGIGDISKVDEGEIKSYPALWLHPKTSIIRNNEVELNFNCLLMDKQNSDKSNITEIMSDTLLLAYDLRTYLNDGSFDEIYIDGDNTIEPFDERFGDLVAGWNYNLKINLQVHSTVCDIPGITTGNFSTSTQNGGSTNFEFAVDNVSYGVLNPPVLSVSRVGNVITYTITSGTPL